MTVGTGATTSQGSVDSLKVFNMFQPPSGGTNQRPPGKPGALFYNFDFKTIEFFDGNSWRQVDNRTTSGRGVIHLGFDNPADLTDIHFVNISSKGNSQHFGDLSEARRLEGAASSETRGVFGGGQAIHVVARQGMEIAMSDSHDANFTKDIIVMKATVRLGLPIYRASAFCSITGL